MKVHLFLSPSKTRDNDPESMGRFARSYLRKYFMEADLGITGCNFKNCIQCIGTTIINNDYMEIFWTIKLVG